MIGIAGSGLFFQSAVAASSTGAYLAARHAATHDDSDAAATYYARALAADPERRDLLEQTLLYKVSSGQIDSALKIAKTLVEDHPRQRIAQLVILADDIRSENYDAAKERLDAETNVAFHPVTRRLVGGWVTFGQAGLSDAITEFEMLEGQDLYKVFSNYHKGLAAALSEPDTARESFDAAIGDNAPSVRLAEAYGRFLEGENLKDEAQALYERTLESAPADPIVEDAVARLKKDGAAPEPLVNSPAEGASESLYGLASAFARDANGVRLSLIYAQLALYLDPTNEAAHLLLGNLLEAQERWEAAAGAYEVFDEDSAYFRHAQVGRAEAFSRIERVDDALGALRGLEKSFPEDESIPIAIGDLLRRSERYEEALAPYNRAIEIVGEENERYWSLYYARGVCNERTDNWDQAQADLLLALEYRPDQAHVLNYLGYSWIEQGRNFEPAKQMIERAVELRPEDGYIADSLGWVQYKLGEFDEAVDTMERAVELVPTDPVINDHYGDTLWVVGRKLEAEFQWRRALSFEPEEQDLEDRIRRKIKVGLDVVLEEEADGEASETSTETEAAETKQLEKEADGG